MLVSSLFQILQRKFKEQDERIADLTEQVALLTGKQDESEKLSFPGKLFAFSSQPGNSASYQV